MNDIIIAGIDVGASSGKMGIASYDGERLIIEKYKDFVNRPVSIGKAIYWDIFSIYNSILDGLAEFRDAYGECDTLAIDTWGASYGLLDGSGRLLEPIYHYRDLRTAHIMEELDKVLSRREIFDLTGCQCNMTYTLPQLYTYITEGNRHILERAETMLFMPDLLSYFLGGEPVSERTIAGTSCLMDSSLEGFSSRLMAAYGIPDNILPRLEDTASIKGRIGKWVSEATGMKETRIIAAVEHDSASAVAAIPDFDQKSLYVSIGTNVNMGIERSECMLSEEAFAAGFKNTSGLGDSKLIYRDFSAGWFITEFRRTRAELGIRYSHRALADMARRAESPNVFIDVEDPELNHRGGDFAQRINNYLEATGQTPVYDDGQMMRCILESIALKVGHYAREFMNIGVDIQRAHIVNGATRNTLLMQLICNSLGMPVYAGMPYATINGNLLTQIYALGELGSAEQMRDLAEVSFDMKEYTPRNSGEWEEKIEIYRSLMG